MFYQYDKIMPHLKAQRIQYTNFISIVTDSDQINPKHSAKRPFSIHAKHTEDQKHYLENKTSFWNTQYRLVENLF